MNNKMKYVVTGLSACLLLQACGMNDEKNNISNIEIKKHIEHINADAVKRLGVDLADIAMLSQSGRNIYILEDSLSRSQLNNIEDLKEKGYITVLKRQAEEGLFVALVPTEKGEMVLSLLGIDSE